MTLLKKILEELASSNKDKGITLGDAIYHPYTLLYGNLRQLHSKNSLYQTVLRAKGKDFIRRKKISGKTYLMITKLGREKLKQLRKRPDFEFNKKDQEWDGNYRIVFFDIPEKDRAVRDLLRNGLKDLGFVGWQKSVWVSKEDVVKELRKFFEEAGIKDYTLVVETKDLGSTKLEYFLSNK